MNQLEVFAEILQERMAQDRQWGGPEHDDDHWVEDWNRFIQYQIEQMPLLAKDIATMEASKERYIKIAALAVAAVECIDRAIQRRATTALVNNDQG